MKKDYFVSKMYHKLLIPSVLSNLGFAVAEIADSLVLGQRMGAVGLATIALCLPFYMLITVLMDGLGIGGSIKFSQSLGAGDKKTAVDVFNRIWQMTLVIGVLIAVFSNVFVRPLLTLLGAGNPGTQLYTASEHYIRTLAAGAPLLMLNIVFASFLRNDNQEVLAARGFLAGSVSDVLLNVLLVIVLDAGAMGAALSTVIGSAISIMCYLPGLLPGQSDLLKFRWVKLELSQIFACFWTGFSTSVQNLFQMIYFLVVNWLLLGLGGENAVAIMDVVNNVFFVLLYLCEATTESAQPLVSTFSGELSEEDCRTVFKMERRYAVALTGAAAVLIFVLAKYLALLFGVDAELLPDAVYALRVYCIGFVFFALNIVTSRYYQAKEENSPAFVIVFLRNLVVAIPCVWLFSLLGMKVFWLALPVIEAVSFGVFLLYRRFIWRGDMPIDPERILRIAITNENAQISTLLDQSIAFCEKWQMDESRARVVTLVLEEVVMSVIRNALHAVPDGQIRVTLLAMENGDFVLHSLDNAVIFNPFARRTRLATKEEGFDIDEVSLKLIRSKSKKYMHRRSQGFNSLTIRI